MPAPPAAAPTTSREALGPPSFASIVQRVSPAVVTVISWQKGAPAAGGSGFIIDPAGLIVTNHHVVSEASRVEVRFASGARAFATRVASDPSTDIALIKVDVTKPLPSVEFGDENHVQVGDWVVAIGSPVGLSGSVSVGILSARGRKRDYIHGGQQFTDYLQITAPINHGNSGGPTFDLHGRVIGINTLASYHITSPTGSTIERDESIGFAIPATTVKYVIAGLKAGHVNRGLLGVFVTPVTYDVAEAVGLPTPTGALVSEVIPGSPAEAAGIKPGDIILKVNGQTVKDDYDCLQKVSTLPSGKEATFTLWREGKSVTVKVSVTNRDTLAELEHDPVPQVLNTPTLGLNLVLAQSTTGAGGAGLTIADVDLEGDAQRQGLHAGDRLIMIGSDEIRSMGDVNLAIEKVRASHRGVALLYIETAQGTKEHVVIHLPEK